MTIRENRYSIVTYNNKSRQGQYVKIYNAGEERPHIYRYIPVVPIPDYIDRSKATPVRERPVRAKKVTVKKQPIRKGLSAMMKENVRKGVTSVSFSPAQIGTMQGQNRQYRKLFKKAVADSHSITTFRALMNSKDRLGSKISFKTTFHDSNGVVIGSVTDYQTQTLQQYIHLYLTTHHLVPGEYLDAGEYSEVPDLKLKFNNARQHVKQSQAGTIASVTIEMRLQQ